MQYVLLTVTDSNDRIISYDSFTDRENYYKNTEIHLGKSCMCITCYDSELQDDVEDFFDILNEFTYDDSIELLEGVLEPCV